MKNVFFALAFMLVGTFAYAKNSKEVEILKTEKKIEATKTTKSDYEIVVKKIIKNDSCTELHVVYYRGKEVATFEAEGEEPCGVTFHSLK